MMDLDTVVNGLAHELWAIAHGHAAIEDVVTPMMEELHTFAAAVRAAENAKLHRTIERLRNELERERMRVIACGVVAMANTPENAARVREMHDDYRSASCDDVARMVDEQMRLRAEIERLHQRLFALGAMHDSPCFACGHNGPGYYQSETHPCAALHHKLAHAPTTAPMGQPGETK
jgi:cell division septum initiation protein DivIVA